MFIMSLLIDGNPIPIIISASVINWLTIFIFGNSNDNFRLWSMVLHYFKTRDASCHAFFITHTCKCNYWCYDFFGEVPSLEVMFGGFIIILGIGLIIIEPKHFSKKNNVG